MVMQSEQKLSDGRVWVACPHCHKKQFPVGAGTHIACLEWTCKACKHRFEVGIGDQSGPEQGKI